MRTTLSTVAECTVPEKILLAAAALEDQGQSPFSAEALIVAVWQRYPRTFGLKGYSDLYPDSNKVLTSIMGVKGLAGRGWLTKVGQKLYALTREGRVIVHRLQSGGEAPPPPPLVETIRLTRDQERLLTSLWGSLAFEKYLEGRRQELTFADACAFWGVGEGAQGTAVNAHLDQVRDTLIALERILHSGDATLSNGRSLALADVQQLQELHRHLSDRFSRHLTLLRSRVGRGS